SRSTWYASSWRCFPFRGIGTPSLKAQGEQRRSSLFNIPRDIPLFDENVDENVIESHISKLRKKLKHRLGFDPIDSKRFLGYCIEK
ncbi:MAG: winged helix-turn-helix domain-containing protein, partial [Roseiarcus sp.]